MIYVHKEDELGDVERRYPAGHYVLVDDKLRIWAAVKKARGEPETTVFPRQGKLANDAKLLAADPNAAAVTVDHVCDLLDFDLTDLLVANFKKNQNQG